MSRKSNLVLVAAAAIGSVLSTSAFAFPGLPGPPPGGLPHLGPPPGAGLPHLGGLPQGGAPAGFPHGGPLAGGHIAAGNVGSSSRGVSGGVRFSGANTFNNYSARAVGSYSGSDDGRSGRYGYYRAAGAAAGYAYGDRSYAYGDQTYTYGNSCYRTVRYETRSGRHTRVVNVCE